MADKVPGKAWVVTFCGTAINLCLGVLYAWSVWVKYLKVPTLPDGKLDLAKVGTPIAQFPGWTYMSAAELATPFSLCVIMFALFMIAGGRIQDRLGPKVGAITGGLFMAVGCIVCGLTKTYGGLVLGMGVLGGIGMGIGYAAPTPAALKWFGPHKRGLVAGLVVGGYGGAALYISPLAEWLIRTQGITGSFVILGIFFSAVVIIAGSQLAWPPAGYVPPPAPVKVGAAPAKAVGTAVDWAPSEIPKVWQFYALVFMFIAGTQSGLLVIANAAPVLGKAAKAVPFLVANAWILASYGGLVQVPGRVVTGMYSDKIGRDNAYTIIMLASALCLFLLPWVIAAGNVVLLFIVVGIAYWQYGGTLALMPAFTADFFGPKNLGMNYGLVFLGWGLGFFMTRLGGSIEDWTGSLAWAFYLSAIVLILGVIVARIAKRPMHAAE